MTTVNKRKSAGVKIERTSAGLRNALFDELDALRENRTTPTRANAVAKMCGEIVNTVQLELNVAKFVSRGQKVDPKKFGVLQLGIR